MLRPNDCKTFADYISSVIQPYIEFHLRSATRIDLVFDRYFKDSLKSGTRSNRGSGVRRLVKPNGSMPNNWSTFLRCDENKTELFPLIVKSLAENINCVHGIFVGSVEDRAVSNQAYIDLEPLMPCNIEEADERMFMHVRNAAEDCSHILVKTVDSDVVVIALSAFHRIPSLQELWIEFGVGKHLKFLPIHEIANSLGPQACTAYLFFHSFSGCDTTSTLHRKGKKSFSDTWKKMASATPVFEKMATSPGDICQAGRDIIEQFVVALYCKAFDGTKVNEARRYLFASRGTAIENIPQTAAALNEHVKRSVLQANKWYECLEAHRIEMDPLNWGWMKEGNEFLPVWSVLLDVSNVAKALISCGCTNCVAARCKCKKSGLKCTEICSCRA